MSMCGRSRHASMAAGVVPVATLADLLGTIMPLFFFPTETFVRIPYAPTLEGQYIIKNLVLVAAGLVIGATVRGGAVVADPDAARVAKQQEAVKLQSK